jgi:hypothetical protein
MSELTPEATPLGHELESVRETTPKDFTGRRWEVRLKDGRRFRVEASQKTDVGKRDASLTKSQRVLAILRRVDRALASPPEKRRDVEYFLAIQPEGA